MTATAAFLAQVPPATRLFLAICMLSSVIIAQDAAWLALAALGFALLGRAARGRAKGTKKQRRGAASLLLLGLGLALAMATQLFWAPAASGGDEIAATFLGTLRTEGLAGALALLARIAAAVAALRAAAAFIDPAEVAEGVEAALAPLARLALKPEAVSTAIAIALRFAQILAAEARTLARAQRARGIVPARRGGLRALRAGFSTVLPLFRLSLAKAERLAVSMESRCFGLERRSRAPLRPTPRGTFTFLAATAALALAVLSLASAPAGFMIRAFAGAIRQVLGGF